MDGYLGVIQALGFNFAPRNWAYCSGTLMAISQNQALFSLLGAVFGGDARVTYGLPDLRGRTPIGQFQGPGLTNWIMGQMPGAETMTLSVAQMPSHTHGHTYSGSGGGGSSDVVVQVATDAGSVQIPTAGDYIGLPSDSFGAAAEGNLYVPAAAVTGTVAIGGVTTSGGGGFDNSLLTIQNAGAGQSFGIMQPSLVVNYCICTQGMFPARS